MLCNPRNLSQLFAHYRSTFAKSAPAKRLAHWAPGMVFLPSKLAKILPSPLPPLKVEARFLGDSLLHWQLLTWHIATPRPHLLCRCTIPSLDSRLFAHMQNSHLHLSTLELLLALEHLMHSPWLEQLNTKVFFELEVPLA